MSTDRDLCAILDKIVELIPNEPRWFSIRSQLTDNRSSALYAAPEQQFIWWKRVADNLMNAFGEVPELDWQKQIQALFTGKTPT